MAHDLADLFCDMSADSLAAESSEEDVVVAPEGKNVKVSSAAAQGARSDAAPGACSDAAHGASSDAAAPAAITAAPASVSDPVSRALRDPPVAELSTIGWRRYRRSCGPFGGRSGRSSERSWSTSA